MARRRYQTGSLQKRGQHWDLRVREDSMVCGKRVRRQVRHPNVVSVKECPTKRLARRNEAVKQILSVVQDPAYRPRSSKTFRDVAVEWQDTILILKKPSTQAAMNSQLRTRLLPALGSVPLVEINAKKMDETVAGWIRSGLNSKTIRNLTATARLIWKKALRNGDIPKDSNPFFELELPEIITPEQPCWTPSQIRQIIEASTEPYRTIWWVAGETGMRRGELCGLQAGAVDCDDRIVCVRKSVWGKHLGSTKSKRAREFAISPELAEQLKKFKQGLPADAFLFTNQMGRKIHPDVLVDRHLKPVLERLGLKGACHAFRHGNLTIMGQAKVPDKTIQGRAGHVDYQTSRGYMHSVAEDDRLAASKVYEAIFSEQAAK